MASKGIAAVNARKTHCPKGHELSPDNTYVQPRTGWRQCRACRQTGRKKTAPPPKPKAPKKAKGPQTHCKRGHEFTPENTRIRSNGWRQCRACTKANQRAAYVPKERKTRDRCKRGHEFTPENTRVNSRGPGQPDSRECLACYRIRRPLKPKSPGCPQGHEWTPENTYRNPKTGNRSCRVCAREIRRAKYVPRVRKYTGPTGDHGTPREYARGCRCTYCKIDHAIVDELIVHAIAEGSVMLSEVPPLNRKEQAMLKRLRAEQPEQEGRVPRVGNLGLSAWDWRR